jgi:DNA-directed RNA polymerase subunit omega
MARITVEDCLERIGNRFEIIHVASERVRQLDKGSKRMVNCKNENAVVALREIAAGKVRIRAKEKHITDESQTDNE